MVSIILLILFFFKGKDSIYSLRGFTIMSAHPWKLQWNQRDSQAELKQYDSDVIQSLRFDFLLI